MRTFLFLVAIVSSVLALEGDAISQSNVMEFNCVGVSVGGACKDTSTSLRSYTSSGPMFASAAGFNAQGDAGGGEFYKLGTQPNACVSGTFSATVSGNNVSGLDTRHMNIGESVTAASGIPQGAEIASIVSGISGSFTMTLAATGPVASVIVSGDNGGTLILDSFGMSNQHDCYQKTNYHGDPHEWGAVGDGTTDDTIALENWLGAYGNVNTTTLAPATAPPNFGPYNASIPAQYEVKAPLSCPVGAMIEGPAYQSFNSQPVVRIFAARQTNGTGIMFSQPGTLGTLPPPAVLTMTDHCRLSGVAVDGNGLQMFATTHTTTTVDNLDPTKVSQIQVGDFVTAADITAGTYVTGVSTSTGHWGTACATPPCVTISAAATGTNPERISFSGPNAVQISGSRDTVDGHSEIENGYNNIYCSKAPGHDGLQLKDSQFVSSGSDNISLQADMTNGCYNVRIIGNVIYSAGGRGVVFDADDLTVSDNGIEQSSGIGLDLTGAKKISVGGNFFDDNGKGLSGGAAIEINGTTIATICNNHITGNGEFSVPSAQIHFGGGTSAPNDQIDLCGNVYAPEQAGNGDANLAPDFVYDADPGTLVTNSHLYETPPPQAAGIFSTNAIPAVSQLQVPLIVPGQISGFILSNNPMSSTGVLMSPGSAGDSSNSVLIQNNSPCGVDLGAGNGEGHLDTGAGNLNAKTTYFYFAIAQSSGTSPNCMASASLAPTFRRTTAGLYDTNPTMNAYFAGGTGDSYIYNVSSVAGIRIGDELASSMYIASQTHVTGIGTITVNSYGTSPSSCTGMMTCSYITVGNSTDYGKMRPGMLVTDGQVNYSPSCGGGSIQSLVKGNTTISALLAGNTIQLSKPMGIIPSSVADCIKVSGGNVLNLDQPVIAAATGTPVTQRVFTGVYRLVGALYTGTGATPPVVSFIQDNDTFYLASSVQDITSSGTPLCQPSSMSPSVNCQLSVPCGRTASCTAGQGVHVEAFGRIVGGSGTSTQMLLSSLDQTDQTPSAFTSAPGYSTQNSTAVTSFPFRTYTDLNLSTTTSTGSVRVHVNWGTGLNVYEVTDGWVFHR